LRLFFARGYPKEKPTVFFPWGTQRPPPPDEDSPGSPSCSLSVLPFFLLLLFVTSLPDSPRLFPGPSPPPMTKAPRCSALFLLVLFTLSFPFFFRRPDSVSPYALRLILADEDARTIVPDVPGGSLSFSRLPCLCQVPFPFCSALLAQDLANLPWCCYFSTDTFYPVWPVPPGLSSF